MLPIILQVGVVLSAFLTLLGYFGVLLTIDKSSERAFMFALGLLVVGVAGLLIFAIGIVIGHYILHLF
jgi:hypothetical protein